MTDLDQTTPSRNSRPATGAGTRSTHPVPVTEPASRPQERGARQ